MKIASNNSLTSNTYSNQTHSQYSDNNLPNNNTSKFNSTTYQIPDSIPLNQQHSKSLAFNKNYIDFENTIPSNQLQNQDFRRVHFNDQRW